MNRAAQGSSRLPDRFRAVLAGIDLFPLRHVIPRYNRARFRADVVAALNSALVAFPQGVACATIAGVPLSHGLFGSAFASLIGPLFTRSRLVVFGPTNATAVLLLSSFLVAGIDDTTARVTMMALAVMLAGLLQVMAAYLNIGSLVAYISRSVIVGYIMGAVMVIISHQAENALGIKVEEAGTFLGVVRNTVARLADTQWPTVMVSGATAAVMVLLGRFAPRLPRVAITLLLSVGLGFAVRDLGYSIDMLPAITASSWRPALPHLSFATVHEMASAALALAFLGILESNSVGKLLSARAGERFHSNQESFALGLANIGNAILGGLPASGSPTRSILNYSSGASTPISTMMCGACTLCLVFGLGGYVGAIPKASLAVIVMFVASRLLQPHQIRFVVRTTRIDATVFFVTVGAALFFPLDAAIFFGTATSILLFLKQAGEPELVEYAFNPAGQLAAVQVGDQRPLPEISIVHVEGSLFFGAAELLQEQMRRAHADPNLRILILRLKHAQHLDASTVLALEELGQFMHQHGRGLIVSGARKDVFRICKRTGLLDLIGRENFFVEWPTNPTVSTRNALKRAQQILGGTKADVRVFGETKMRPA